MTSTAVREALAGLLDGADHVDVKAVRATLPLRQFVAAMLGYQPAWVTALYWVRRGMVRLLGLRQNGIPVAPRYSAAGLPCSVGSAVAFFRVVAFEEEYLWAAQVDDDHLRAVLAVVAEPSDDASAARTFEVVTIVHYRNWAGRVYFNVIRPFHHLVVGAMARAGGATAAAG